MEWDHWKHLSLQLLEIESSNRAPVPSVSRHCLYWLLILNTWAKSHSSVFLLCHWPPCFVTLGEVVKNIFTGGFSSSTNLQGVAHNAKSEMCLECLDAWHHLVVFHLLSLISTTFDRRKWGSLWQMECQGKSFTSHKDWEIPYFCFGGFHSPLYCDKLSKDFQKSTGDTQYSVWQFLPLLTIEAP